MHALKFNVFIFHLCQARFLFYFSALSSEKKPTPLVTREPDSDKLYAGESVSLNCKVPVSSGWEYQWYKDEENISSNSNFIIHNASSSDNGIYKCRANRDKSIYKTEMSDERVFHGLKVSVYGEIFFFCFFCCICSLK
uniref:Ig-like domain-containing protein n=1 Tax=Echeneis naucrates TaxID=173247 RepID=A0A665U5H1_ECHNA